MHARLERWWSGISLRSKITGVTVLLVTAGLLVVGVGTLTVLRTYLVSQVDSQLQSAYAQFISAYDDMPADGIALSDIEGLLPMNLAGLNPYYIGLIDARGERIWDNLPESEEISRPATESLDLLSVSRLEAPLTLSNIGNTAQWRTLATVVQVQGSYDQASLLVGLDLRETNGIIGQFVAIFFGFGFVAVLLCAAATRLVVTSTFAPLREVEATAARFAEGDYSQRLGGATPNTEVGRLNRSLNTMLARIDRAFADRARTIAQMRRFIGDASHELRTPLVSLRGYAELYRMGAIQQPADVAQAMDRIEREAIRMGGLVEDLLELARLEEAKPAAFAPVDLLQIARDAALDASVSSPDRQIRVVTSAPEFAIADSDDPTGSADPSGHDAGTFRNRRLWRARDAVHTATRPLRSSATWSRLRSLRRGQKNVIEMTGGRAPLIRDVEHGVIVLGEENRLRQVVTNLMGNAMRFTSSTSPIEIEVSIDDTGGFGVLCVVDHGDGIPPEIRERIFERFWRADTSRTRETGGSGLGLAIVAGIVAGHSGHVEVLETPGGGATFRVSLPLLHTEPEPDLSTEEHEAEEVDDRAV